MASVQLIGISKRFGDIAAVNGIDVSVQNGEFFSLLGPSGCGKTTILRMIAGFYMPTAGKILFDKRDVSFVPPNKRNTGMVFQNYALFPHMTVFENVAFGLRARKTPKPDRRTRVMKALEMVNLSGLENRHVTQLSGGQQQRVALARAIVIEPEILLLDEPLSNLDAKLRRETRDQIRKLQQRLNITTIYVTHDQEEALTLSDRIALLNEGICQQIGTPQEIHNRPSNAFVASFIGRSNLIDGVAVKTEENMILVRIKDSWLIRVYKVNPDINQGENVILSIRPEVILLNKYRGSQLNLFKGTVRSSQFNGYVIEYEVDMKDISLNAIGMNDEINTFSAGDEVYIEIPANRINIIRK